MKAKDAIRASAEGKKKVDKEERKEKLAEAKARRKQNAEHRDYLKVCAYPDCLKAIKATASKGKREASYAGTESNNPSKDGNFLKKLLEKDGYAVEVRVASRDHYGGSMDLYISHSDYWPVLKITW